MDDPRPSFAFSLLLPVIQLLVCIVVLRPYWFSLREHVRYHVQQFERVLSRNDQSNTQSPTMTNVVIGFEPEPESFDFRLATPAALNLPVGFVQLPIAFASNNGAEWAPGDMTLGEWRALTWPFLGLVFWWIAGRGFEALFAATQSRRFTIIRPSLHWLEVMIGFCFLVAGSSVAIVFAIGHNPTGLMTHWVFAAGASLWALLGAVIVTARILQSRIRRRVRREAIAYLP